MSIKHNIACVLNNFQKIVNPLLLRVWEGTTTTTPHTSAPYYTGDSTTSKYFIFIVVLPGLRGVFTPFLL